MDDTRAAVAITPREHEVIAEVVSALAEAEILYQRGGQLVHVLADDHGTAQPKITELPLAHLRTLVSATVRFTADKTRRVKEPRPKLDAKKPAKPGTGATPEQVAAYAAELAAYERAKSAHAEALEAWSREKGETTTETVDAHPPDWAIKGTAARGQWPRGIRPLDGFSEVPFLRPDGSIADVPGYDQATRTILVPNARFLPVAAQPTEAEARASLDALAELLADFPFEGLRVASPASSPTQAVRSPHRAAALAALLTPFARHAFRGPTPLFLVDANVRGAGKSKLTDTIAEIVLGRPMARTSQATHEEEERKRITSILLAAPPLVLIDNIDRPLGSAPLDAVLTAEEWSDRVLGKSDQTTILARPCWYGTGNNIQIKSDTARRCCHIRLTSPLENPEARTGFRFPDLIGHVRRQRPAYVRHALTVLRAWYVAGRPAPATPLRSWGSYEQWSGIVRHALVWLGEDDPGETRAALELYADSEANALADLLAGWSELCQQMRADSLTTGEALAEMEGKPNSYTRMRDALAEMLPTKPGQLPGARSVGMKFAHLRERVQDGRRLVQEGNTRGAARWRVAVSVSELAGTPPMRDCGTTGLLHTSDQEEIKKQKSTSAAGERSGEEPQTLPLVPQSRSQAPSPAPPPPNETIREKAQRIAQETGDDPEAIEAWLTDEGRP